MPITTATRIVRPSKDNYHTIDHVTTGLAFEIHNDLGRLLDEHVYQTQLASRANLSGYATSRELKISVKHKTFSKDYFIDLMLESGVPIEAKAAAEFTGAHRAQLWNYLFLCDLSHGTLLNFRPNKVQHEFVTTHLTLEDRRKYFYHDGNRGTVVAEIRCLKSLMSRLLDDWGTHLSVNLYRDAIIHLLKPTTPGLQSIDLYIEGRLIGTQRMQMISDEIALSVTAISNGKDPMKTHLARMIQHTHLAGIAWINMDQSDITFTFIPRAAT